MLGLEEELSIEVKGVFLAWQLQVLSVEDVLVSLLFLLLVFASQPPHEVQVPLDLRDLLFKMRVFLLD